MWFLFFVNNWFLAFCCKSNYFEIEERQYTVFRKSFSKRHSMWYPDLSRKLRCKSEPNLNPWPWNLSVYFYSSLNLGLASLLVCFLIQFWGRWSSILITGIELFMFHGMKMSKFCFSLGYHMSSSSQKCVISVSSNAFKNVPCCDAGFLTDQPHSSSPF